MSVLTLENTENEVEESDEEEREPPLRNPGRFTSLKCAIAEVAWIQRMIGRPVSPLDWAMFLHPEKEHKTRERSWERFKSAIVKWKVPHEKIVEHRANVTAGKGSSRQILIRLKLRPEDVDTFFWDYWQVPMPGFEKLRRVGTDAWGRKEKKPARPDKGDEPGRASRGKTRSD